MHYFLDIYLKFEGKMNRAQFFGAFLFYIFLLFLFLGAGYLAFEILENIFMTCQEISIDLSLEPNGPIVGTLLSPDCHSPFPQDFTVLTVSQKIIVFCVNCLFSLAFIYPLSCLCAKRFNDIALSPYIPVAMMMLSELINPFLYVFINYKSNISIIIEAFIIVLCLLLPTKLNHKSVSI